MSNPDPVQWDALLDSTSGATLFQSSQWRKVLADSFGYRPVQVGYSEDGVLRAGMPLFEISSLLTGKRLVSSPFSAVGGCIGDRTLFPDMLAYIRSEFDMSKYNYLQIRSAVPLDIPDEECSLNTGFVDAEMVLDTPQDDLWKKFPVSIRTAVRKAEKNGVTVRQGSGERELSEFYMLNLLTRKGFGTPSFSKGYFRNITDTFPGSRFYLAEFEGKVINGVILVPWGGTYYYFYVGADPRYRKLCGSDYLVWKIIEDAYAGGIGKINFGRMEKDNSSLAFFKKKWGSHEIPLYYYSIPRGGFVSSRKGMAHTLVIGAFRKMPLWMAALVGPSMTKRLG